MILNSITIFRLNLCETKETFVLMEAHNTRITWPVSSMVGSECSRASVWPLLVSCGTLQSGRSEYRRVRVPPNRLTPLRQQWENIMQPIVEHLKLQIRYNAKNKCIGAW